MASAFDDLIRRERSTIDFLNSLSEQTESILRPIRDQERLMERMLTPGIRSALNMHEQLVGKFASALPRMDYTAKFLEEATKINSLLHTQRRAFADISAIHSTRIGDQVKDLMAPRIADTLKAFAAPSLLDQFRNALTDSATASLRNLALPDFNSSALSSTASIARFMQDAAKPSGVAEMLNDFLTEVSRLTPSALAVTPEGIQVEADLVAAADLTAHLREAIAQAVTVPRQERLREFLAQCLVIIRSAPKPVAKALIAVVTTILLWVGEGEVQAISTELLAPARRALIAKIRKLTGMRATAPPAPRHESSRLRVVTAKDTLNVRIYPRKSDSRILGTLQLGTVVVAVREVKDWTLVEYMEEDSIITGWVYTRHLKKVVLPPVQ